MSKTYIDRINVYGFKSYGNRKITIPLGKGFIGIVGPNGSGKSNIGDAIVFALGLATAKSMRALKLTDLIFSSKGKSSEYAEVEIIFKNEGAFPFNTDEVSIYRKIELNGKSTYKINGRPAKYYEVEELLAEAGIPKQAYNIVTQGDIFRFIKMTPTERRDILSDLAGISEYEEKKQKALKELEEIEEKLKSATLVLKEIKRNLERLEEEKKNAEKAQEIEERIKLAEYKIKGVKLFNLIKTKEETASELEKIEEKIENYLKEKEELIQRQKGILERIKEKEDILEEIQREILPFKEKEGYINSQIKNLIDKEESIKREIETLKQERENLKKEIEKKQQERKALEEKLKELNIKKEYIEEKLAEAEGRLEEKNKEIKEIEDEESNIQNSLIDIEKEEKRLKEKQTDLEKKIIHLELELKNTDERINSYKQELEELREKLEKNKKIIKNFEGFTQTQERKIKSIESEIKRLEIRKQTLEKRLQDIREKKEKLFQQLAEVLAKLSHIREDKIITALKDIDGVLGQVAELIAVKEPELTKAIEVAGGGRLKNIVVRDDRVAEKCIQVLKEKRLGRTTFIPLNRIRANYPQKPPLISGVLGLAIDFIDYPKEVEKAIFYVFGDTIIVKDFETARRFGIGSYRMTTIEGDLFEKSGVITGGRDRDREGLLNKGYLENERRRLEEEEEKLKREEDLIFNELKTINNKIAEREKELIKIQTENENIFNRYSEINEEITFQNKRIDYLEEEIFNLEVKKSELKDNIEKIKSELEETKQKIKKLENEKREILEIIEKKGLNKVRKEWEELLNNVYRFREGKSQIENEINLTQENINYINREIEELESRLNKSFEREELKKEELKNLQTNIENFQQDLVELIEKFKAKEEERKKLHSELIELRKELSKLKKEEEEINRQISFLLEGKGKLEQKLVDLDIEIEELKREYQGEAIEGDIRALEKELKELRDKRLQLGAVNQRALEDFNETKERYIELSEKVKKLKEEKTSVEELIQNLEEKKINAFREVYEKVNKNLNKIFKRLSPGGKAYLELENEENPLEAGVYLKAKPRGKDVKRLEIMSGGEKTLTALAFLFAVQQYKPAPFYYFDEVDAHLDDANARKIAELMKEFSKEAQFIVVTLRDTMASYADKLIGVSSRDGISQIYTLNLEDIKQE